MAESSAAFSPAQQAALAEMIAAALQTAPQTQPPPPPPAASPTRLRLPQTASGNDGLAAKVAELEGQLESLQHLAYQAPASTAQLLAVGSWRDLLRSVADVQQARRFLEEFFIKALTGAFREMNESLLKSLLCLMTTAVEEPAVLDIASFREAAHHLVCELLVAKAKADGLQTKSLASYRSSLQNNELPTFVSKALDNARTMSKLTDVVAFRGGDRERWTRRAAGKKQFKRDKPS